ncbi:hypothetical protein PV11_00383 [Exophiala sideris]|uniref:Uncharacterized protein n=1 Tax=Exophiala sideris TaxID=1016849 RepID=A0A0D1W7F3_9EURO|nr:hypothetical protein PV11_00383 [Exophiala sideris]
MPTIKQEVLQQDFEEEELPVNTDDEEENLDLDEEELHLQLRLLQHRRRRLQARSRQRKTSTQSSRPSTAQSVSITQEQQQRSNTPSRIPATAVFVELLSDDEEPQVKVEADDGSESRPEPGLEFMPPAEDRVMTDVTGDPSTKEGSAPFRSRQNPQGSIPFHTRRITPIEGAGQDSAAEKRASVSLEESNSMVKAPVPRSQSQGSGRGKIVPNPKIRLRIPRPKKTSAARISTSLPRRGPTESENLGQNEETRPPIRPNKKRLTKKEQLTQEAEELLESSSPPDASPQGARARPPAGTYRIGLTQEDGQRLLARFCTRTVNHVDSRLRDDETISYPLIDRVFDVFGGTRRRLQAHEYTSIRDFTDEITTLTKTQLVGYDQMRWIRDYLGEQEENWGRCFLVCDQERDDEKRMKIVDDWALLAEQS